MKIFNENELKIYSYAMPVLDSRMYIVISQSAPSHALIIDPLMDESALDVITQLSDAVVLLTHSHYDHISGVNWLRSHLDITLKCTETCSLRISDSHQNLSAFSQALVMGKTEEEQAQCMEFFDLNYSCSSDELYAPELSLRFGNYQVTTTQTPGHSPCSQCILLSPIQNKEARTILFTGDSLVNGNPIITRLPGGSKKDYLAVTKLFLDSISQDVLILPGHGDAGFKNGSDLVNLIPADNA